MVLVSNEWQSKCEDETKTTATAASTTTQTTAKTTTPAITSTATTAVAPELLPATETATFVDASIDTKNKNKSVAIAGKEDTLNSITPSSIPEPTVEKSIIKTTINDNTNNEKNIKFDKNSIEIISNNNFKADVKSHSYNISEAENLYNEKAKLKEDNNLDETTLNYNNKIKVMAENTKEFPLKEEKESEDSQSALINNHSDNNKDLEESNSYSFSDTNTLQASSINQSIITQPQQQQVSLSCPITPQTLSCALQSALNASNNANNNNNDNNIVAAAGLQPNFLSQLALAANVAGLQKSSNTTINTTNSSLTAKQLNQSFNILDATTTNNQTKSDSNILEGTVPTTSSPAISYDSSGQAKIVLICEGNSHPFQTRTISLTPNIECMVGRLIAKSKACETNAIFDCKVLSRKHAVIWYTPDGKFWVKDTKSSNGTFINDNKLGDEEAELHFGDIVKFGVDVLENSRKEVHGCIIACVKLYLPDGREAISIDSSAHRSQYSGEGRISYDELHRLNLYIQETSQREKVLTSKLCNIQNVLDATRKNSALCWQSMITEDQLLHRIHSLEKKLQFMEKNVPENVLRNEVLKLLDDKSTYQLTAKEALRKVYQERCDAMQMLAKMETAYAQSDNECALLRDQIMNSKQTLQEVNARLIRLETEYNEYKDEMALHQQEAKEREEQRIAELTEKLRERELECEDLKKKITELLIKRADQLDDEEHLLEKQAIEKLDAAIADMGLGDYGESDGEEIDGEGNDAVVEKSEDKSGDIEAIEAKEVNSITKQDNTSVIAIKKKRIRPQLSSIFGDNLNDTEESKQELDKSKLKKSMAFDDDTSIIQKSPPKRVKETTIMKWLQNSDLNKNEGSFDIFKAICNENENDESDKNNDDLVNDDKATKEFNEKRSNFTSKLKNVQMNLQKLEAEIEKETDTETVTEKCAIEGVKALGDKHEDFDDDSSDEDDDDEEGACADKEFIIKRNSRSTTSPSSENQVLSKENKKYLLLKSSVNMLREAYNEIWHSVREQNECCQKQIINKEHADEKSEVEQQRYDEKEKLSPPHIKVKTQLPSHAISPNIAARKFEDLPTLQSSESDIAESDSDVESLTLSSPINSSFEGTTIINVKTETANDNHGLTKKLKDYESQIEALNKKLQQTELEAQHTLEIMQVECDDVKMKMENLNKVIEALRNDKIALEHVINENKNNSSKLEVTVSDTSTSSSLCANAIELKSRIELNAQLEKEMELEEDPILNAINVTALEREEELILYKERLDEQQKENIKLRNEIALLKQTANAGATSKDAVLKQYLPYSFVALAIIVYFLTTYF